MARQRRQDGVSPKHGLREENLNISQVALGEAALAVAQIELPHADEGFWKTKGLDPIQVGEEILPPQPQGPGLVRRDVLQVEDSQIGFVGHRL